MLELVVRRAVVVILCLSVCSCAVFKSKTANLAQTAPAHATTPGTLAYFLPTGRVHLHISEFKSGNLTITPSTIYIADPTKACFFRYRQSVLSDDQIKVTLTDEGLLSSVTSTTTDATPQIFQNLGELAANTLKIVAKAVGAGAEETQLEIDEVINPLNTADVAQLNHQLNWIGLNLIVTADIPGAAGATLNTSQSWGLAETGSTGGIQREGIFYRPVLPYRLTFLSDPMTAMPRDGTPHPPLQSLPAPGIFSVTVALPNEAPVMAIDVSRAAFVTNSVTIAFSNGMLKDIAYNKPSQASGLVQIPVDLSRKLLSVPDDLLTIRYANVANKTKAQTTPITNQTTLLNDQARLLEAQTALIAAQKALREAQKAQNAQNASGGAAASVPCTGPACP
jgi:hypothetical protein